MTTSYCDQHMITGTGSSVIPVIVVSLVSSLLCADAPLEPMWGQVSDGSLLTGACCLVGRPRQLPFRIVCPQLLWKLRHRVFQEPEGEVPMNRKEREGFLEKGAFVPRFEGSERLS